VVASGSTRNKAVLLLAVCAAVVTAAVVGLLPARSPQPAAQTTEAPKTECTEIACATETTLSAKSLSSMDRRWDSVKAPIA